MDDPAQNRVTSTRIAGASGNRWLDRSLLVATLLTCAVALSPNSPDPDLWGHVQYGRDLLRDGLPATTTYSYSAEGYRWINHENLAEVLLALGMDSAGPVGMLVIKCLLGVGLIVLIMLRGYRDRAGPLAVSVVAMLVAVNLTYFWSMRPQLLSFVYFGLLLFLLGWCFSGWEGRCHIPWLRSQSDTPSELTYSSFRLRFLWLAPLLLFVWANSHGGFVAGYCIFVAYLLLRGFEAFLARGRDSFGLLRRLGMMILAGLLATLINPYGPNLHLWLLDSLRVPRPEILEWHAPDLTSSIMLPLWLIMFSWFALLLLSKKSRDITHLVILAITLWQSLEHVRHIPFFALAFGFWMAPHVESVLARFNVFASAPDTKGWMKKSLVGGLSLAFLLLGLRLYGRLSDMPVKRSEYPIGAFQFIADRELDGRLVVTYNWAQYAIAAFGPNSSHPDGLLVSFDGRFRTCYPQNVVDMNFDFILGTLEPRFRGAESQPFDDQLVLEFGEPDLVLVNRRQPHSVNVMFRQQEDWTLLYQDQIAQLWGRRNRFDDESLADYIPVNRRSITNNDQTGSISWPALPVTANGSLFASVER